MATSNTSNTKTTSNTPAGTTEQGPKEGNRPAQAGQDDQQIVGQTLAQARENGHIGGQIVKEAVARGLEQMGSSDNDTSQPSGKTSAKK